MYHFLAHAKNVPHRILRISTELECHSTCPDAQGENGIQTKAHIRLVPSLLASCAHVDGRSNTPTCCGPNGARERTFRRSLTKAVVSHVMEIAGKTVDLVLWQGTERHADGRPTPARGPRFRKVRSSALPARSRMRQENRGSGARPLRCRTRPSGSCCHSGHL
jgi:hypothetical protein